MKHNYFKLNEDDILSIVKDYLLAQLDYDQSQGNLALVQSENDEIHVIAAFGEANDNYIQNLNLQLLASDIALNGPVSSLNDNFYINFNSPEAHGKLKKLHSDIEKEDI